MAHKSHWTSSLVDTDAANFATSARLIDRHGAMSRVSVDNGRYSVVTTHEDRWTEASVDAQSPSGAIEFRTARSRPDGSVVARAESWGDLVRITELEIDPQGSWESQSEHHHPAGWLVRTRAQGTLAAIDDGIQWQRIRFDKHGNQHWRAEAETTYDRLGPGRSTRWLTSGAIEFASGGTGSFQTIATSTGVSSGGTWKPFPAGPGAKGSQLTTRAPDGTEKTTIRIDYDNGSMEIRDITSKVTGQPAGGFGTSRQDRTVTIYDKNHHQTFTSSDHESLTLKPDGSAEWENTHTDASGKTETERGVYVGGRAGSSVTESKVNKDGSVTLTTTTWDTDGKGTRHVTEYGPGGDVKRDDTQSGTVAPGDYARVPGDVGEYFRPDSSGGSGRSGGDSQPSGGRSNGSGEREHPDSGGEDNPEHPDNGGEASSDDYGDGDMGDDTGGGTPGLGWDGGGEGPLGLLPGHGAGVIGHGFEGIDTTGEDTVAGLIAQVLKHVVAQGGSTGSTGDAGLGEDVTGSGGIVITGTDVGHVGLASSEGDWGDFTDPKATLSFARQVLTTVARSSPEVAIQTAGIVHALRDVHVRLARTQALRGR